MSEKIEFMPKRVSVKGKSAKPITEPVPRTTSDSQKKAPLSSNMQQIYFDEFVNIFTREIQVVTVSYLDNQANRLREWAMKEDSLLVQDYTDFEGYSRKRFYDWCSRYEPLEEAYKFALSRIGSRRELGTMQRKFESTTTQRTLGYYQDIWKSETKELHQMKEEANKGLAELVIEMTSFPRLPGDDAPNKMVSNIVTAGVVEQVFDAAGTPYEDKKTMTPEQVARKTSVHGKWVNRVLNPKKSKYLPTKVDEDDDDEPAKVAKKAKDSVVKGSGCRSEFTGRSKKKV